MKYLILLILSTLPIGYCCAQSKSDIIYDSTHNEMKIEVSSEILDNLVSQMEKENIHNNSIWKTLLPLLIGAFLTLSIQLALDLRKEQKDNKLKIKALISKANGYNYLINQVLKDLAMYKVHKQYYRRASIIDKTKKDRKDSFKKHYVKGEQQRKTEAHLDQKISEYLEIVTEYAILKDNLEEFENDFNNVRQFSHPISSKFESVKKPDKLEGELKKEEKRLREEFEKLFEYFSAIQTKMIK